MTCKKCGQEIRWIPPKDGLCYSCNEKFEDGVDDLAYWIICGGGLLFIIFLMGIKCLVGG